MQRLRGPSLSTPAPAPDFFTKEPVAAVVCLCHLAFALLLNLHVCVCVCVLEKEISGGEPGSKYKPQFSAGLGLDFSTSTKVFHS